MQLESKNLLLRPLASEDFEFFRSLHLSQRIIKYISDPLTDEEIKERFNARLGSWIKESNKWLCLTIIDKSSNSKVGLTGFKSEWTPYSQAELGFMLAEEFQGKGYGSESTQALLSFAFDQCDFHKITATVTKGNIPSESLLSKLGFTLEGTIRDNFRLSGKWAHDLKFGMLKAEFDTSL